MKKKGKECLHCHKIFIPDRYNHHFQKYCTAKECRHASRLASRRVYRNKPKNKTPEKRIIESERVLKWQKLHPKYWKNKKRVINTCFRNFNC